MEEDGAPRRAWTRRSYLRATAASHGSQGRRARSFTELQLSSSGVWSPTGGGGHTAPRACTDCGAARSKRSRRSDCRLRPVQHPTVRSERTERGTAAKDVSATSWWAVRRCGHFNGLRMRKGSRVTVRIETSAALFPLDRSTQTGSKITYGVDVWWTRMSSGGGVSCVLAGVV